MLQRRTVLSHILPASVGAMVINMGGSVQPAQAGEVGARITKAVTQSELGISVRRSVVQGAQLADQLDGQWEQFSDQFGLGTNRKIQPGRPQPKVIPPLQPLNVELASSILTAIDATFCSMAKGSSQELQQQIGKVQSTVAPSFARSSASGNLAADSAATVTAKPEGEVMGKGVATAQDFNFASYVHFKAFSDLILQRGNSFDFAKFKVDFEQRMGQQLVDLVRVSTVSSTGAKDPSTKRKDLAKAIESCKRLCQSLVQAGLVACVDVSSLEEDDVLDWSEDLADLSWSIALDGEATLQAQILLQEQGFRLYPNYGRYAIQYLLQQHLGKDAVVNVEDYYMDTDYNSDPNRFEVKEVLLNINIQSE